MRTGPPSTAWRVLLPTCAGTALSLAGDTTLYTVLSTHTTEAGIAFTSVGLLLSLNRWVRLPLNRLAGGWIEKRPRKPIFVAALILGAFSTYLYTQDQGLGVFLAARALWGIAWVGIWLAGNTIVLDISDQTNRGRLLGIYQIAFFTGAGGGAFLGGLLTDWLGYHPAMYVNALLSLLGGLLAWAFLPETWPPDPQAGGGRGRTTAKQVVPPAPSDPRPPQETGTTRRPAQLATALTLLAVNRLAMQGFLIATIALFFRQQLGETVALNGISIGTATLTGLGLGATTLVSALAAPISGSASDRAASRWRTAAVWLLPGILGFALLPLGTPLAIAAGLVGISAASGSNINLATALIGDLGRREHQGRRLGTLFTAGDLASAAGPPLAFWLLPLVGLRGIYWSAAGLFALIFLFSAFWAFLLRGQQPAPEW